MGWGALQIISSPGLRLQNILGNFVNNGATDRKWWIDDGGTKIYIEYERDFEEEYDVYAGEFGRSPTRWDRHFRYKKTRSGSPPATRWASV